MIDATSCLHSRTNKNHYTNIEPQHETCEADDHNTSCSSESRSACVRPMAWTFAPSSASFTAIPRPRPVCNDNTYVSLVWVGLDVVERGYLIKDRKFPENTIMW